MIPHPMKRRDSPPNVPKMPFEHMHFHDDGDCAYNSDSDDCDDTCVTNTAHAVPHAFVRAGFNYNFTGLPDNSPELLLLKKVHCLYLDNLMTMDASARDWTQVSDALALGLKRINSPALHAKFVSALCPLEITSEYIRSQLNQPEDWIKEWVVGDDIPVYTEDNVDRVTVLDMLLVLGSPEQLHEVLYEHGALMKAYVRRALKFEHRTPAYMLDAPSVAPSDKENKTAILENYICDNNLRETAS